jgi:hypothetical protein
MISARRSALIARSLCCAVLSCGGAVFDPYNDVRKTVRLAVSKGAG